MSARVDVPDGGVAVGEPFKVIIDAAHAPGGIALLPEDLALDQKLAERRSARRHVRAGSKDKEVDHYELELLAFEAGELDLPAIPLAYGSTRADTRPLTVDVKSGFTEQELPIATSTLAEAIGELDKIAAQDPNATMVLIEDYVPLIAGGAALALALIAFLVWRYAKSRRELEALIEAPPPPPRPAHEVALERIAWLRATDYLLHGDLKTFYAELSEILRAYVGARYGFDSLDLTVSELMTALAKVSAPGLDARVLEELLDASDLVKFAKFTPAVSDAATAINVAEEMVQKTKQVAPPPSQKPPQPRDTGGDADASAGAGAGARTSAGRMERGP